MYEVTNLIMSVSLALGSYSKIFIGCKRLLTNSFLTIRPDFVWNLWAKFFSWNSQEMKTWQCSLFNVIKYSLKSNSKFVNEIELLQLEKNVWREYESSSRLLTGFLLTFLLVFYLIFGQRMTVYFYLNRSLFSST